MLGKPQPKNAHDEIGIFVENEPRGMRIKIIPIQETPKAPIIFIARDLDFTLTATLEFTAATPETNEIMSDGNTAILINIITQYSDIFKTRHHIRTQFRCTHGTNEKWDCATGPDGNEAD